MAVLALPCMLYSMDLTVLNLALPSISAALAPTSAQLLWIVDVYGFLVAAALIPMGALGDRIGRRKLLLAGAATFGVASVAAAFATSAPMLIALRALLGLAGATLAPSTLSLIRNIFRDPGQRTVAIGIWISSYSAGAAIGPVLGGIVLERFSWGAAFLIGVPVMALLLVAGPLVLPEFRDPDASRVDLPSAGLSLAAVLSVVYGLKRAAEDGPSWMAAMAVGVGVVAGVAFVSRQRRLDDPLVDLRLFRRPRFSAALGAYTLGTFVAFGIFLFVGQYLQLVLGLSPLRAGLWSVPFAIAFIVGSLATPRLVRHVRVERVIVAGLVVSAAGFVLLARLDPAGGPMPVAVALVVYSLGLAPVFTLATDVVVGAAPPERAGSAGALSETGSELGGALGIAVLGSIGTAVYRTAMAAAHPAGVPSSALALARRTLGGAVAASERLQGAASIELLAAARDAFVDAFHRAAIVGGLLMLATAAVVAFALRGEPHGASAPH